jgi:ribonuclease D
MGIELIYFLDTRRLVDSFDVTNKSTGLNHICQVILDLEVDKTFQCSPWNLRPLPVVMERYACLDSILLLPILGYFFSVFGKSFFLCNL